MHEIYKDKGVFDFLYQIPQIIYSSLFSILIQSIIKFLSITEEKVIEVKEEKRKKSKDIDKKIKSMFLTLKIKFILFFIIAFIILFFSLYYITCFCSIYKNTQIHLIKDSLFSFLMSLLYPFITYLLPGIFRILALRATNNNGKMLYNFSKLLENI